jgi:hypothetical protein
MSRHFGFGLALPRRRKSFGTSKLDRVTNSCDYTTDMWSKRYPLRLKICLFLTFSCLAICVVFKFYIDIIYIY